MRTTAVQWDEVEAYLKEVDSIISPKKELKNNLGLTMPNLDLVTIGWALTMRGNGLTQGIDKGSGEADGEFRKGMKNWGDE